MNIRDAQNYLLEEYKVPKEVVKKLQEILDEFGIYVNGFYPDADEDEDESVFDIVEEMNVYRTFIISVGLGFTYPVCTMSYADGPDADYHVELTEKLKEIGFEYVGIRTTGCDERNWENYNFYDYVYGPSVKYID